MELFRDHRLRPHERDARERVELPHDAEDQRRVSASQQGKGKHNGEDPAWSGWVLQSVWLGFRSSLGAVGTTCLTASSLSQGTVSESIGQALRRIDCNYLFPHPISLASDPDALWSVTCSASPRLDPWHVTKLHRAQSSILADSSHRGSQLKRAVRRLSIFGEDKRDRLQEIFANIVIAFQFLILYNSVPDLRNGAAGALRIL